LIFFSFSVFVPRMQLSMFLCPLHVFPMVAFGFTTPVCQEFYLQLFSTLTID